jgi:NADPH:quinone reductase-like Zn-dependent oxidoreductase
MFGYKDGFPTPFPFIDAVSRNLNVRGYSAQDLMTNAEELRKAAAYVSARLASGEFNPRIDKTFPLDQLEAAYTRQRQGRQIGKIIVAPLSSEPG